MSGRDLTFYYDNDRDIVGETQTITLTVTVGSKYTPSADPAIGSESFTLTFLDPCTDNEVASVAAGSSVSTVSASYDGSDVFWTL